MKTVIELPANMRDPLRRSLNRGVMVQWINADLMDRCGNDVRKSIVFYDDAGVFETALPASQWGQLSEELQAEFLAKLYALTPVRYYSKGI
jgi:hypothetical protein